MWNQTHWWEKLNILFVYMFKKKKKKVVWSRLLPAILPTKVVRKPKELQPNFFCHILLKKKKKSALLTGFHHHNPQFTVFSQLLPAVHNDPLHEYNRAFWRLLLMSCLCVPGSSMRRVIQRRSVSSTRPWSTATPSSPLSPSSELWDASRLTLLMQPERWVRGDVCFFL